MSNREYLEVTLHTKAGGQIVAAMDKISTKNSVMGDGYTSMEWTSTEWDDLPKLHSIDLQNLAAVTTRQVREETP